MRISDWSSDVCSSDLRATLSALGNDLEGRRVADQRDRLVAVQEALQQALRMGILRQLLDAALAARHQQRVEVGRERFGDLGVDRKVVTPGLAVPAVHQALLRRPQLQRGTGTQTGRASSMERGCQYG